MAEIAGIQPMPWQAWFVRLALQQHADRSGWRWAVMAVLLLVPRQNGKGTVIEIIELYCLFSLGLNVYHTAHLMKTSRKAFKRLWGYIEGCPALRRRVLGSPKQTAEEIVVTLVKRGEDGELVPGEAGAQITFMARSSRAGRGLDDCDVLILDEALYLEPRMVEATVPTMSTRPYPLVLYASSAGVVSSLLLRALRARMESGDPTLTGAEWSIDPEIIARSDFDPLDPDVLAAANPSLGALISLTYCVGEHAEMTADGSTQGFLRERLGVFDADPAAAQRVIPAALWRDCEDPQRRPPDGVPSFALAGRWPDADETATAVAGWRGRELVVQVLRHEAGDGWCVEDLVGLVRRHPRCRIVIDEGGPVGHLVEPLRVRLREEHLHTQVAILTPSPRELAHASKSFRAAVVGDDPFLRHFGQTALTNAVLSAGRRPLVDAWYWQRRGDTDISPLEACTLAAWGAGKPAPAPPAAPQAGPPVAGAHAETADLATASF